MLVSIAGCSDDVEPTSKRKVKPAGDTTAHYDNATTQPAVATQPAVKVKAAPKPTTALPEGTSCQTAECHANYAASRIVHAPVSGGECMQCHAPDNGGHKYPLKRTANETCTFCHKVSGMLAVEHKALQSPGCLGCHNPHASNTKFLLVESSVEMLCAKCHQVPLKKFAHEPFAKGQCTVCHEPHESANKNLLRGGTGPDHCFMCHADTKNLMVNSSMTHKPATQDCVICHSPHATEQPHQLKAPVRENCTSCHKDLEKSIDGVKWPHQAVFVNQSCANCHNPHASSRPKLLLAREDQLCLKCHDKDMLASDGRKLASMKPTLTGAQFLHGPVKSGDCTACHNAHGAAHANLLRQTFPEKFYTAFDLTSYALCFSCHDKQLVLTPKTVNLTGFRDGDVNLHFLHVNRAEKGRTCRSCHDVHGSDNPKHMAGEVPFEKGQWSLPLAFEKTVSGGRCAPGCHEPYSYDRTKVISKIKLPTTQENPDPNSVAPNAGILPQGTKISGSETQPAR